MTAATGHREIEQGINAYPFGELCYSFQEGVGIRCQTVPFTGAPNPSNPFLFSSPFRTIYNEMIYLRPDLGAGAANCVRPGATGSVQYAAPKGRFTLHVEGGTGVEHHMLCGLAGTENIVFQSGDYITLYPLKPAHAPSFPLFGPTATSTAEQGLLTDRYTTSWGVITPGPTSTTQQNTYYAQPQQSPLFQPGGTSAGPASGDLLNLFNSPAASFGPTAASGPSGLSFPLFAYASITGLGPTAESHSIRKFSPSDLVTFEQQFLGPTRKKMIENAMSGVSGGSGRFAEMEEESSSTVTTSPQGFLTEVQGTQWKNLVIAKSTPADPGVPNPLQFNNLPENLQNALQSNQLFMVASDPAALGGFDNVVSIEGWPFTFDVGDKPNEDLSNILIFKFRTGRLVDLVANSNAWTQADTFNEPSEISNVSTWLQDYMSQAQSWVREYPEFQGFVDLINNPAWNGVLCLKVNINLNQFPSQLKGLLGGMDLSQFNAHHVGVEVNYVHVNNGILEAPKSSLFALINYVSPSYAHEHNLPTKGNPALGSSGNSGLTGATGATGALAASKPYNFDVEVLQVLFSNSKIKDFYSKIKLTATTWFDQLATVKSDAQSSGLHNYDIELDGHYEDHHGHPSYTFTTNKNQHYTFELDSPVLNYVEVSKAQFITTHSKTTQGPTGISTDSIDTAFNFWGYMNFKSLPGMDIFSFGSPAAVTGATGPLPDKEGLYFSNLAIDMNFDVLSGTGPAATAPKVVNEEFIFQPNQIAFDTSQSTLRTDSLLASFPMAVQGLMSATIPGATGPTPPKPSTLGYREITLPSAFEAGSLGDEWYALHFHLQMGSMGALAAKAGFVSDMIAAWSPTSQAKAMLGIKLPGGDNTGFSLESILKLKIEDIVFTRPGATGASAHNPYMLQLKHMGMSLVGMTLPPNGNIDLYLFGPTASATALHPSSLGWYGAYVGPTAKGPSS